MTSSAVASSGPSWQVDIPGLSQLILNVEAHGLKQLAMAGNISQLRRGFVRKFRLPARLSDRRDWFYKTVEFGTATNFLADQLLKTRAGENVLALMAATVPVMDEEICTLTISTMFEDAKVSPDNIPGLVQLKAIRSALVALARKVGVGEKILNYHKFLCSLVTHPGEDPYLAIPFAKNIASIIRMLHKLVSNEDPYIFISQGLLGAAWILAYAGDILGLPVCALRADGTPIPVTGSYEDAKVLLEVESDESKFSLYLQKDLKEQITFLDSSEKARKGWSIDCTQVNSLDYCHAGIATSESLERISTFTALETLNHVSFLARTMSKRESSRQLSQDPVEYDGFVSVAESQLIAIQARSLKILWHLGFRPGAMDQYKFVSSRQCPTFIAQEHTRDSTPIYTGTPKVDNETEAPQCNISAENTEYTMSKPHYGEYKHRTDPYDKLREDRIYHYMREFNKDSFRWRSEGTASSYQDRYLDWRPRMQRDIAQTMDRAVYFAAYVAFSDWEKTLRQISVNFFSFTPDYGTVLKKNCLGAYAEHMIPLCMDGIEMIEIETRLWTDDWLALDLDGVIVHRYAASHNSIHDLQGVFLGFIPGRIVCDGNRCSRVRSDRVLSSTSKRVVARLHPTRPSQCGPRSVFPHLSVRSLLTTVYDTLYVRLEAFLEVDHSIIGDISLVCENLPDALVSISCHHGYHEKEFDLGSHHKQLDSDNITPYFTPHSAKIYQGIILFDPPRDTADLMNLFIQYQQVHNSPLGQWLACT